MEALRQAADAHGFPLVRVADVQPLAAWARAVGERPDPAFARLSHAPGALLPGARAIVLLARPYQPFEMRPDEPTLDAYYPVSNEAHRRARALAAWIEGRGYAALASPAIAYKPLAARTGLGEYGRNSLIATRAFGSRVALQAILTAMPLPAQTPCATALACEGCDLCVRACPVGALSMDGRVDMQRCLRALPLDGPLPVWARPQVENRLLGCDLCQRVCPKNARIACTAMPEALGRAIEIPRLLAGEWRELIPWIGRNYARKARLQARTALVAANLGRHDARAQLAALRASEVEAVREHARWALARLDEMAPTIGEQSMNE